MELRPHTTSLRMMKSAAHVGKLNAHGEGFPNCFTGSAQGKVSFNTVQFLFLTDCNALDQSPKPDISWWTWGSHCNRLRRRVQIFHLGNIIDNTISELLPSLNPSWAIAGGDAMCKLQIGYGSRLRKPSASSLGVVGQTTIPSFLQGIAHAKMVTK
eukprot:6487329-Amphidinium_carterae.2